MLGMLRRGEGARRLGGFRAAHPEIVERTGVLKTVGDDVVLPHDGPAVERNGTVVGNNVVIKDDSIIKDSIIWDNVIIGKNVNLNSTIVDIKVPHKLSVYNGILFNTK